MNNSEYLGIRKKYQSEIKRSSSRFLGFIEPVSDETHANLLINNYREAYSNATHVCYAMLIGTERSFQKFSDAGEPFNSAGRPMLNVLLSSGTSFVLAVVVRYYGGKKLGIPGLIEAYGAAIEECLQQAQILTLELKNTIKCSIAPENQHLLFNLLHQEGHEFQFKQSSFVIRCSQSMTAELLISLSKIPTLLLDEL